jgi:hypothetical protein
VAIGICKELKRTWRFPHRLTEACNLHIYSAVFVSKKQLNSPDRIEKKNNQIQFQEAEMLKGRLEPIYQSTSRLFIGKPLISMLKSANYSSYPTS